MPSYQIEELHDLIKTSENAEFLMRVNEVFEDEIEAYPIEESAKIQFLMGCKIMALNLDRITHI
jgi:N-acetylglutamate synthase-like GNAT family acetyltransferase